MKMSHNFLGMHQSLVMYVEIIMGICFDLTKSTSSSKPPGMTLIYRN